MTDQTVITELVTTRFPAVDPEVAAELKINPETMQRILDAFDCIADAFKRLAEWAEQVISKLASFVSKSWDALVMSFAPPKWRHYAIHAKKARIRKKYRDRIRRSFWLAMASEGGGSS